MGAGCKARHLSYSDAMEVALMSIVTLSDSVDSSIVKAALANAKKVYNAVRKTTGSCRGATLREAAQLLYDAATLKAAENHSGVVAATLAYALLRLNGLTASMPWLLQTAATVCRNPDAITPEEIAEAMETVVSEGKIEPSPISAIRFNFLLAIDEETVNAFYEALEACSASE